MAAMPHHQVAVSLKTRLHRDGQHRWTSNDVSDIDALSVAVAYCDAVFADAAMRSALVTSKELDRLNTFLPRKPAELATWLRDLSSFPSPDLWVPHPPPRPEEGPASRSR